MQPRPGMPESFRDYLRQRWRAGAGMGALYWRRFGSSATSVATRDWQNSFRRGASQNQRPEGRFSRSPTHRNLKQTTSTGSRQLSPQVAAALLSKVCAELTSQQAQIVDTLKRQCPGFAVMRKAGS
jgi:hypothetical protein